MTMKHLSLPAGLAAALLAVFLGPALAQAQAQAWPTKPVKIIVTTPPGLPPDVLARGLAPQLEARFGQPFVVENRPGASTIIGTQACAAAAPDGHTLCLTLNDTVSLNPHLFTKLPYDPDKSLAPVAILAWPNSAIVVNAATGLKTFKEVVEASKAKPGTLNFGSFGNGSSAHLYLEWMRAKTGWDVTHVPYASGALQPTLAGQVQLTYLAIGALKPHIDAGKLTPIAVAGLQRSPFLPDVPTFGEVGLGDFYVRTWFGLFAPAGTPAAVVEALNKQSVAIVNDPGFRAKVMDPLTLTPGRDSPAEMAAYMKKDREVGAELVRIAKVKLD
jgi:tripartite-type tricarboxylate transporter receptor subunit TctC